MLATMSACDAVRCGSRIPCVSSTSTTATNVHAVQSRQVVRRQINDPSAETGARMRALQMNSARLWVAVDSSKPTAVPRSRTHDAMDDCVPDVGASSATASSTAYAVRAPSSQRRVRSGCPMVRTLSHDGMRRVPFGLPPV